MATTTRPRPRSLPSTTTKLSTEMGNLYVTVSTDEDGEPFEVFGWLGKGARSSMGSPSWPAASSRCTCGAERPWMKSSTSAGAYRRCFPFFNRLPDGKSIAVLGIGDGIAHVLKQHLKAREEARDAEAARAA